MSDIVDREHYYRALRFNELIATFNEAEDLINIGAYVKGSNPQIDHALAKINALRKFLKQDVFEKAVYSETIERLQSIIETSIK